MESKKIFDIKIRHPATRARALTARIEFLLDSFLIKIKLAKAPIPAPIGTQPCKKP